MLDHIQQNRDYTGLPEDRLIGIEEVIVPFHVIKYRLRDGSGSQVKEGMTIYCQINVFLIDGTQIVSSKGSKVTKFLIGRKRLIRGLELGLLKIKKNEKLRLVISPQYAYGMQEGISLVPPNSKLIFQIDVLDFSRTQMERMTDTELYYQVYHYLDQSESLLRKGKEDDGLYALTTAYKFAKKIKHYKCSILGKILLKWANILYHRGEFQDALLILNRIDRYDDTLEDCLRLFINLYQALNRREDLQKLIERMYEDHINDNSLKRICVNYYKQTQNWDKLKKLPGYDFKKDRFGEVKQSEKERNLHFRMFT